MAYSYDPTYPGQSTNRPLPPHEPHMSASKDSSEEDIDPKFVPTDTVLKTYGILNTSGRVNFRIHAGGSKDPVLYYCNNSMFTPKTPDVQLHTGDDKNGPIVAFAKFHNLSRHVTLGLGDPNMNPEYEELHKETEIAHSGYVFETAATHDGIRRKFIWRRTVGKNLYANYVCLDGGTGKIMAYFASTGNRSMRKVGKICVTSREGDGFEQLLLVSLLSIREKESRNAWYTGGILAGNGAS